ncbi:MAG: hypothetical protein ACJAZ9_002168 [Neolewinella sp.]|jgi:hypothetical protein
MAYFFHQAKDNPPLPINFPLHPRPRPCKKRNAGTAIQAIPANLCEALQGRRLF